MPGRTATVLVMAFLFFSAAPAFAQDMDCGYEDVKAIFCEDMANEELYDKYNFDSYKMLTPGKSGWIFRSQSDFRTDFTIPDKTLDYLEELSQAFRNHGTELVILITPTRAMIHSQYISDKDKKKFGLKKIDKVWDNYWSAIESIRNRGIHVVGIQRPASDIPFFYRKDHHWNPYGAQIAAQAVAAYIKKMPEYQDIEKVEYVTHDEGVYDFYGVSKKVFKKLCGTRQAPERVIRKITERKQAATASDDLFGDAKQPAIALLGTSNSTMEPSQANFEGFLNEELSADILNMSVSGGGLDTAMVSYLNSDQFRTHPAKIAIWEIPGYYDLSNHNKFFRQAIPALYGTCENNAVAIAQNKKVEDQAMIALSKLADKNISGGDYYLSIDFDSPVVEPVTVDLRYVDNRDKYKFDRSKRYPHDGEFFVSLPDNKKERLEKVVLDLPEEARGKTLNVMLCKKKEKTFFGTVWQEDDQPAEPKPAPADGAKG